MTTIKTNCGDTTVELGPDDLTVILSDGASYGFVCPHCDQVHCRPADPRVRWTLAAVGVRVVDLRSPPLTLSEVELAVALLANVRDLGDLTDERGCW